MSRVLNITCATIGLLALSWTLFPVDTLATKAPPVTAIAARFRADPLYPPSAWLHIGGKAVRATQGSYCWHATCVDMISDERLPHLMKVHVGRSMRLTITIMWGSVRSISAQAHRWTSMGLSSAGLRPRQLRVHRVRVGNRTLVTIIDTNRSADEILDLFVTFAPNRPVRDPHVTGGDSSYVWRLTP